MSDGAAGEIVTPRTAIRNAEELRVLRARVAELEAKVDSPSATASPASTAPDAASEPPSPAAAHGATPSDASTASLASAISSLGLGGGGGGGGGGDPLSPKTPVSPAGTDRPQTADTVSSNAELFITKVEENLKKMVAGRKPLVLVCTGFYNPIHLQHTRMFYLARNYLTAKTDYQVVGGVLSVAHDNAVREQLRRTPKMAIPARHRVAMCEKAIEGSSWLAVSRWEATRRSMLDYPTVLRNMKAKIDKAFPTNTPHVMYLCGADHLLKCGPSTLKSFGCIAVSRPGFTEKLEKEIGKKYRRLVHLVDDTEMLTETLVTCSSTKVRRRFDGKKQCADLVGKAVAEYIDAEGIADKCNGSVPWAATDKLPVDYGLGRRGSAARRGSVGTSASRA